MEDINIQGTPKTPGVEFKPGSLLIQGRSIPENSIEFYKPLIDWISEYSQQKEEATSVDIKLEYFNTSSSKCILDVFKRLEGVKQNGTEIHINWYYEEDDEDMLEAGEDYEAIINIPFKMIEVEEM
jgi:hypothetical protein